MAGFDNIHTPPPLSVLTVYVVCFVFRFIEYFSYRPTAPWRGTYFYEGKLVAGAALILECLQRGLYPGWDAHDLRSLALAKKLGYHLDYPYTAYELTEEEQA